MSKKVYVGVGHGGTDPGATGNGFLEKNITLSVANYCTAYLTANGVTVKQSRTADITFPVKSKVPDANEWGADLVMDIHINAGGGKGAEVYCSHVGGISRTLAQNIQNAIVSSTGVVSRGVKIWLDADGFDHFGMIRSTNAPAVLIECCFIDTADIQNIDTAAEQKVFGEAIGKGVLDTLGIVPVKAPAESAGKLYHVQTGAFGVKANADRLAEKLETEGYDTFIVEG